jgi:hypothetical protein
MRGSHLGKILVIALITAIRAFAQDNDNADPAGIFGRPSRNPCIVGRNAWLSTSCAYYGFNDEYSVGVERDKAQKIVKLYLSPKNFADLDSPLTEENKNEFLRMVSKARDLGSIRFAGEKKPLADKQLGVWEVYDNALLLITYKNFDGTEYLPIEITVHFPVMISGFVSFVQSGDIGNGHDIKTIYIDGCRFLTTMNNVQRGSEGIFPVINGRDECNLPCYGSMHFTAK